jgi:hypothetical protein
MFYFLLVYFILPLKGGGLGEPLVLPEGGGLGELRSPYSSSFSSIGTVEKLFKSLALNFPNL